MGAASCVNARQRIEPLMYDDGTGSDTVSDDCSSLKRLRHFFSPPVMISSSSSSL